MRNKLLLISLFMFTVISVRSQHTAKEQVNKASKEFGFISDQTTPLNAFVSFNHIYSNGKQGMLRGVMSKQKESVIPKPNAKDVEYNAQSREKVLSRKILEVRYYGDSVAAVISDFGDGDYLIGWMAYENGRWVVANEDIGSGLEKTNEKLARGYQNYILRTERIAELNRASIDFAESYSRFLKSNGVSPEKFVMKKLATHKLVIVGEVHRRKVSWDLMKEIIKSPGFSKHTGTVFVELPAYKQENFDRLMAGKTLDKELILDAMRAEQPMGWWDGGMYEFIQELWNVNRQLPKGKKIKLVAVDFQLPWNKIHTKSDFEKCVKELDQDRNTHMADVIEAEILSNKDKRGSLLIVGYAHAYKSSVPGGYSTMQGKNPAPTAGAQLTNRLSAKEVFIIFPHSMIVHNVKGYLGELRDGLFDRAFTANGDIPVAFDLKDSPFGSEPFDALDPVKFDPLSGCYEDNFDGYIFFGPLDNEGPEYYTEEIYTDDFVEEIKRRVKLFGSDRDRYFGIPAADLTREKIIDRLNESAKKSRWK